MNQPSHTSWIGHTIGDRYKIEALLGQGGMSSVYRATDPNLRRTVAVKLIHPHLSSDPEFVRRFEQEAAAVAQLRHPNIIQVYDFNHDDDVYYMVLEYVPGDTLQSSLKTLNANGQLMAMQDVVNIMATICDAVAYAHEKGMIHRDLKPANVMLNPKGQPILMDFGVAKMLGTAQHTATGAIIGTAKYMSPEQARGMRPDERTDIYSLGVMLYELVTGATPFEGESTVAILMKHVTESLPDIKKIKSDIPDSVANVITKALEKERENRYQTVSAMAAALRSADLKTPPPAAAPPPEPEETILQSQTILETTTAAGAAAPISSPAPPPAYTPGPTPPPPAAGEKAGGMPMWLIGAIGAVLVIAVLAGGAFAIAGLSGNGEVEVDSTAPPVAAVTEPTGTPTTPPPSPTPVEAVEPVEAEETEPAEETAATDTPLPPEPTATAEAIEAAVDALPTDTPAPPSPTPTELPPSPTPEPPTPTPEPLPPTREGMTFVPGGTFQMGSSTGQPNERPEHQVSLDSYFIDTTEVTNAQYRQCVNAGVCSPANTVDAFTLPGYRDDPTYNNYPVISVTWDQAQQYCQWAGKRLPTEAEWEYAASGPDNLTWPWGNSFNPNLAAANSPDVQPVTSFPGGASPYGVLNMAGNVNEWVADVFSESFYANSPARNPISTGDGDGRVYRGGSFDNPDGSFYTTSRRYGNVRSFFEVDVGFRCAADAP